MKTKRHAKILEIIHSTPVDTQDELLKRLRECGFDVTQATVSRDIKELRLIKTLDSDGGIGIPLSSRRTITSPPNFIPCSATRSSGGYAATW